MNDADAFKHKGLITVHGPEVSIFLFEASDDTAFRVLDEVDDVLDFYACRYLFFDFDDGILEAETTRIDEAVGICDMAQNALCLSFFFQYEAVHTMVGGGVTSEDDVGRYVFLHAASALQQTEAAYMYAVLQDSGGGKHDVVIEDAVAGDLSVDANHAVITYDYIMTDVHTVHKEVVISYGRSRIFAEGTCDDNVLTYAVVVADVNVGKVALFVAKTLGGGSNDRILIDIVVVADDSAFKDGGMSHYEGVISDYYVLVYVSKGLYLDVLPQFGGWVNVC